VPNHPVRVLAHHDFAAAEAAIAEASALLNKASRERRHYLQVAHAARAYEHVRMAQRALGRAQVMSSRSRTLEAAS
jgi:hypothetical protein